MMRARFHSTIVAFRPDGEATLMRYPTGVAAIAAWMLCGCSTAPDQEPLTVNKQPVYRTGSNIAVKEGEGQTRVLSVRPDDMNTTKIPRYPLGTGGANGP